MKERRLFVGVRYRRMRGYSGYTSTLVATIYVGNRKRETSGEGLRIGGRPLLTPHLYVVYWPQRSGLFPLTSGYYVQPGEYSVPEGPFKNAFANLDQAVAHGRGMMRECLAASKALEALGVGT